eukprot:4536112-Pyramimonas_sp.AAC.1
MARQQATHPLEHDLESAQPVETIWPEIDRTSVAYDEFALYLGHGAPIAEKREVLQDDVRFWVCR